MGKLGRENQTSFVHGRQTADNFSVAQEDTHSLNKKRGKTKGMVMKVDLKRHMIELIGNS